VPRAVARVVGGLAHGGLHPRARRVGSPLAVRAARGVHGAVRGVPARDGRAARVRRGND